MSVPSKRVRFLVLLAAMCLAWLATSGVALAQESEGEGGGGGASVWILPYAFVILCVGLGVFVVCRSSARRDKPRDLEYQPDDTVIGIRKDEKPPVISVGMRVADVNKLLGKPTIARRGDDIYRELAQTGKLSDEEAAKEHLVYEVPVGRYELVALEGRIVQIKSQPVRETADDES